MNLLQDKLNTRIQHKSNLTNHLNLSIKFRKLSCSVFCYLKYMSRALCQQCQRPEKACICAFSIHVDNHTHVLILQHPSEVNQSKGTVSLLQQSLTNCQVIIGEVFDKEKILSSHLRHYGDNIALLYPSEQAFEISFQSDKISKKKVLLAGNKSKAGAIKCIIILDGTWKKAYRMFMLNPCLHDIKHIVLPVGISSLYQIRKTKKDNALSSLEACCHALARLEDQPEKYQALLNSFIKFNQFQQSFSERTE